MSRDPIGYRGSPGNLFLYAESRPVGGTDSFGLTFVHHSDRGVMTPSFVGPTTPQTDPFYNPDWIRMGFEAQFDPIASSYSSNCGKLCNQIGFTQVVRSDSEYTGWTGFRIDVQEFFSQEGSFHLDEGELSYDLAPLGSPLPVVGDPTLTSIKMGDGPAYLKNNGGSQLISADVEFETCVVCLQGAEGPATSWVASGGLRSLRLTNFTTYACTRWGYSIKSSLVGGSYSYTVEKHGPSLPTTVGPTDLFKDAVRKSFENSSFPRDQ